MISDFPHLIKCLRNGLMKTDLFWTPDGFVMKNHWQALLDREGYMKCNLRIAYKLTPIHLHPTGNQTMNVPLAFEAIQNFDRYLRDWERAAKEHNQVFPISSSTVSGLKVTLGSTLELIQFLHSEHNFDYLMTVRLNQDALERFFGMMRNACGSNDHPDPTLFAQVFRLLASYSLAKPPKGGNVCGVELLQTLMQTRESIATAGCFTNCEHCIDSVETDERTDRHRLIDLMNHYGGLLYPSDQLFDLTQRLEAAVLDVVGKFTVKIQTLHQILDRVAKIKNLPYIGCKEHHKELTKKVLNFYIVTRGHFLGKSFNNNNNEKKIKFKALRKNSKL